MRLPQPPLLRGHGHKLKACSGAAATKFWTFRWEYYYCAPCREYEWCGSKTRESMTAGVNREALCVSRISSNKFFNLYVFFRQQFLSYHLNEREHHRLCSFRGHSTALTAEPRSKERPIRTRELRQERLVTAVDLIRSTAASCDGSDLTWNCFK